MWVAPVGVFGAIAAAVGETGWSALRSLAVIMVGFYLTCSLFVFAVLGSALWLGARVNIFTLLRYLAREFLLILSTSSSESALPRLMAKMEHLGVSKPVVGVAVPTGYSFHLDDTAIYLTMAPCSSPRRRISPGGADLPVGVPLGSAALESPRSPAGCSRTGRNWLMESISSWASTGSCPRREH
jgi:aerobic C4-dicarboxylate transport protein